MLFNSKDGKMSRCWETLKKCGGSIFWSLDHKIQAIRFWMLVEEFWPMW